MRQDNGIQMTLIIAMLLGGVLGAAIGIILTEATGNKAFIPLGPTIGTALGMTVGMALQQSKNGG